MSRPLVEFGVQSNWQQVYSESRQTIVVSGDSHAPLPVFEIPYLFENHILAVRLHSPTAKPTWRFGGMLRQRFEIGSGGTASPLPTVDATAIKMTVNRSKLVTFPRYTSNYQLSLQPPTWFKDLLMQIWIYTGIVSDTTEHLVELTRTDLVGIELKIDELQQRQLP